MTEYTGIERRKEAVTVEFDRRISERVAILEVTSKHHAEQIDDTSELIKGMIERLDSHIVDESTRDLQMQTNLIEVGNAVNNLSNNVVDTNETLKRIAELATANHDKVTRWDTILTTVAKLIAVTTIVIGAAWSVYTFTIDHGNKLPGIEIKGK